MALYYIADNYINSTTLPVATDPVVAGYCSSEDPTFQLENLYNKQQSKPFRWTGAGVPGTPEWVLMDMGVAGIKPTIIAIMNHELIGTGGFSLVLRASAVNPPVDGWLVNAAGFNHTLAFYTQNIWDEIAPSINYQYWRLDVIDPNNTIAGIGESILHIPATFTRNYNWGYGDGMAYISGVQQTHYGQRWKSKRSKRKKFSLRFEHFTDANLIAEAEAFFEAVDGENPVVFIPDDSGSYSWYCDVLGDLDAIRNFIDQNSFTLQLEEQVRGITLL